VPDRHQTHRGTQAKRCRGPLSIEGACDWEINRRVGRHYQLLPPEAAIDPSEDAVSIEGTNAMRASFASSDFAPAVLIFFDALASLLAGGEEQKH